MHGLALCAGVGGLEIGLKISLGPPYSTVCYVERESYAAATLVARMEDEALDQAPVWSGLQSFHASEWRGVVDIVTAGYPCQPFSVAGRRGGESDPRHLWPDVARIIGECEPSLVFLENVSNHLRLGFRGVAEDLRRMGYKVAATVLRAEEVGAPHRRERLFALAYREGERLEELRRSQQESGKCGSRRAEPAGCCKDLDDTPDPRHPSRQPSASEALRDEARGSESDGRCPDFPPGPTDSKSWSTVLVQHPELRPAISQAEAESLVRGMADGMASRVDRLRACGNGVVPLQAAFAFTTLARALKLGVE